MFSIFNKICLVCLPTVPTIPIVPVHRTTVAYQITEGVKVGGVLDIPILNFLCYMFIFLILYVFYFPFLPFFFFHFIL